jgi:hypothetical protein
MHTSAITWLGCECVPEDVVFGKHAMIGAKVALVRRKVERCQLIVRYRSFGADWLPIKVIFGQAKNGWKL